MSKRSIIILTLTFLTAGALTAAYSQSRRRIPPSKRASAPARSPLAREAELENQIFWERLFAKCGDSYFGEVAPSLSQMRMVTFATIPRRLSEVDIENGYEWRGTGVFRFGRRRIYTMGRWSDWVSAREDWTAGGELTAVLQKKRGEWSAVYSPFDWNIIRNRPTCEGLSQYGIEVTPPTAQPSPQSATELRAYGFNVGRAVYAVQAVDRVPTKVTIAGYSGCVGEFWVANHVASLKCAKPALRLLGTTTEFCPACKPPKYAIEWHDEEHSALRLGLTWDIHAAVNEGVEIRDVGDFRLFIDKIAKEHMIRTGIKLEGTELLLGDGRRFDLRRGGLHRSVIIDILKNTLKVSPTDRWHIPFFTIDLPTMTVRENGELNR